MTSPATITAPPRKENLLLISGMAIAWAMALAKLVFHIYTNNRYGYFVDDFNYMSCGDHLQWGYVDHPPLIPFLTHITRAVLGDSLRAIRFIPALATSLLIVQTAALTREFGGRRYAQVLSAVSIAIAGVYLTNGNLLTTSCLEPNIWMGCVYFLVLAIKNSDPRYWLGFGVIAGIGLEEKYGILVFGAGIVIGLLLTAQRRSFLNKWLWLGGAAAFLIFLPNLLWNIHYDWPFVQLMHGIRAEGRDVVYGPIPFFIQQTQNLQPLNAPIWIIGLIAFFTAPQLRPYHVLGWCYVVCYATFFVLHGKNYYLAPVYPMLLAAGTMQIENWLDGSKTTPARLGWKHAIIYALLTAGVISAPMSVPLLPPATFVKYLKFTHTQLAQTEHFGDVSTLPEWYADQFGWKEIADEAALAWSRIPPDERPDCGIFTQFYADAGAIDFYYKAKGLPPVISGDRTFWLWGPRGYSGNCMVVVLRERKEDLERLWNEVEFFGRSAPNQWALSREIPVFICRGKKFDSMATLWPSLKHWR